MNLTTDLYMELLMSNKIHCQPLPLPIRRAVSYLWQRGITKKIFSQTSNSSQSFLESKSSRNKYIPTMELRLNL